MEVDWEVEVGGGAPVIDALWPGFIDLRRSPERLAEIVEAAASPALSGLLRALNGPASPLWTAKCDLWLPENADLKIDQLAGLGTAAVRAEPLALACYVDILPCDGKVFSQWEQAEALCRSWIALLAAVSLPGAAAELIVRQALAGQAEGYGVTAYLSAKAESWPAALALFATALDAFAVSLPSVTRPATGDSKLQWKSMGE